MADLGRVLVTGATGFIGSHLVRRLAGSGVEVHAVVRPTSPVERLADLGDAVRLVVDDGGDLSRPFADVGADVCFHLATRFSAGHGPGDIVALIQDNIGFPTRVADACTRTGVGTFVNTGTAWQHVGGAAYRPKNLYAATKQAFEDVLVHFAAAGLRAVTVNLYDTYGPDDPRGKIVSALAGAAGSGTPLAMSSGHQLIDLVHVDDVVDALVAAVDAPPPGPYAVSSGDPRTLRELVALVADVVGRPLAVEWGARPDRPDEMLDHWHAGPPVPGWTPRIDLERGLRDLLPRVP